MLRPPTPPTFDKKQARTCKKRIGTRRLLLFLAEEIHRGFCEFAC
jgi:hypothetical protein